MTQLPLLPWFRHYKRELDWFCVAAAKNQMQGDKKLPQGWTKPQRQQVNPQAMDRICSITWDVPQAELEAALSQSKFTSLQSPPVYTAGSGWQLALQVGPVEDSKPRPIGVYFQDCIYECQGEKVAPKTEVIQVDFTITHQPPGSANLRTVRKESATLTSGVGWGQLDVFKASSLSDLQPHLVDGHLKLGATFKVVH
jgi:hypothetical protein